MRMMFQQSLTIAILSSSALLLVSANVWAGDCPPDKVGADVTKPGATAPSGLTDEVIASIDLSPMGRGFTGYRMRMRKLTIKPGGVVPWHSHGARPSDTYITS